MPRLAELQNRIRSLGELRDVIGAMRSLSSVRVQQAQETLLAIRQYTGIVESALAEAAPRSPLGHGGRSAADTLPTTAVVALGSEHGFVGAFNEHILDHAVAHLVRPGDRLLLLGSRGAMLAAERHHPVAWAFPMASHAGGVEDVALRAAEEIAHNVADGVTKVVLVYTKCSGAATWRLVAETLLPFDVAPYFLRLRRRDKPPPLSNLADDDLFEKLVEELAFAQLTHAVMESFASENVARLGVMKSAHDHIEDTLAVLSREESEGRQEEITTEMLDVVTGAEAMVGRSA